MFQGKRTKSGEHPSVIDSKAKIEEADRIANESFDALDKKLDDALEEVRSSPPPPVD